MIPLMDFQDRSLNGPVMKSDEFDMAFAMKVREVVEKYDIRQDPEEFLPDDKTADAIFHAAVDLLADVGLYQLDTLRVVKVTKEEILQFVKERKDNPGQAILGQGADEMTIQYRQGTDSRPPTLYAGPAGVAAEEWFLPLMQSYAQEESIAGIGIAAGLEKLGDIVPKAGTLSEIQVGLWEQEQLKEALRRAGRPDMSLGLLCTVSTVGATMHCIHPDIRQPHNTQIGVHILPEQKVNWDRFILAHFCQQRGIVPWQSSMSMIGGLCRNAVDVSVGLIANMLGQMSYAKGPMCSLFTNHMDGNAATPDTIWAVSAAKRANERNIGIATGSTYTGHPKYRRTPIALYQAAAVATAYTASGSAYAWIAGHTALEAKLIGQVMKAVAGLNREDANDLARRIMAKAEEEIKSDPSAKEQSFPEVYDLNSAKAKPEFESGLQGVMDGLSNLGVNL